MKYHVSYIACSVHFKSKFMGPFQRRFMGQGVGCSRGDQQATGPMRLLLWMEFLNWKIPRNTHIWKPRSTQRYGHFHCNQNAPVDVAVRIYVYYGLKPILLLPATYLCLYLYSDFEVYFVMSIPMEFRWCAISMGCMFAQFLDCVCFGSNKLKCLLPFLQIFHFLRNSIPWKTSPTIFDFRFYHYIRNV